MGEVLGGLDVWDSLNLVRFGVFLALSVFNLGSAVSGVDYS